MSQFTVQESEGATRIQLTGNLIAEVIPNLQTSLRELLSGGKRELIFDMEKVEMLDSSGICLLIATSNSLSSVAGRMEVINVAPEILRMLQAMRLASRLNARGRE